ncbi:carbohydrate-binding family 9-like protein [Pedobacter insulae]|uniref:Carbohydrate-binding family 9 n=1 Tax=Pedobacter insulae TaxID=414048 RepID=A0A1I2UYK2_9SPHI|nr:carbohydrate-binding family 9-like protein [Pedobacter insulae]SFG82315.1 Carbohydrate-binding family 9 [Pedobacter insulae]
MRIPLIESISYNTEIEKVSQLLDALPQFPIKHQSWEGYPSNCEANFVIAHAGDAICLKFYVKEDVIKVSTYQTNGRVHKDNCVEFFVAFGTQKKYYNIEFNCTGICLVGFGEKRLNRILLDEKLIAQVQTQIKIISTPVNSSTKYTWEITALLPIEIFEEANLLSFHQLTAQGNFFKCGDDLPQPHFYSWNKIEAKDPDFHLPEFFGALMFD